MSAINQAILAALRTYKNSLHVVFWIAFLAAALISHTGYAAGADYLYGVLQSHPDKWNEERAAGIRVSVIELSWREYEPQEGFFDAAYISRMKKRLAGLQASGFTVVLDPGWQYPPAWVLGLPDSRYRNQFGDPFSSNSPGMAGFNAVFNKAVRERQEIILRKELADLGTDFYAIRLGGGWFNELNYPPAVFKGHQNCYWAFDDIAQGRVAALPEGMTPCPVAGWIPGTPGDNHEAAERFANWYMDSLKNYHDWQIAMARKYFSGPLAMLYPSWGIRPGQLSAAIAGDLSGKTSPEVNGEIQRGFDFARFIRGISDPNVIVYCTWLDAEPGNDESPDPAQWRPIHFLSSQAAANPLKLKIWGENTGSNDSGAMGRCFQQMRAYHLIGLVWAFEGDLYDGRHAPMSHFAKLISEFQQ